MGSKGRSRKPLLKDFHLWSEVTRSVSPLKRKANSKPAATIGKPAKPAQAARGRDTDDNVVWTSGPKPAHAGRTRTLATRQQPQAPAGKTIEPRVKRRLMRGQLPIDATLDLHGLRQSQAHAVLSRFIMARYERGDRTILVITGKGLKKTGFGEIEQRGVLRTMLPRWLSEPGLAPMIAGWEVAAQTHGGEGAFYVRLRRRDK